MPKKGQRKDEKILSVPEPEIDGGFRDIIEKLPSLRYGSYNNPVCAQEIDGFRGVCIQQYNKTRAEVNDFDMDVVFTALPKHTRLAVCKPGMRTIAHF